MNKKWLPIIIVFLSGIFSIFYFSTNINSWKFSFVGDEWTFYTKAVEIANKNLFINPFNLDGVWGQNPVLFSFYQAIFIKIFGASNFGWRISTIVLIIPLSIFFYLWLKQLFQWKVALVSTLILQTSFYLANFLKIGYPNPLSLTFFIIILYLITSIYNNLNSRLAILLGIIVSLSFYVYIGILFPLILFPYLIVLFWKKYPIKKLIIPIGYFISSCLLFLFPYIFQFLNKSTYFKIVSEKTVLNKEYSSYLQPIYNIFNNFILFFRNNDIIYNHFVTGPYLDYLTQLFVIVGLIYVIINIKNKSYKLLLILFISLSAVIGVTSPYPYSPITRGIFFLPFGFAFAGIGLNYVLGLLNKKIYWSSFLIILALIFFINLYHGQIGVFKNYNFEPTALIIKFLKEEKNINSNKTTFLVIPENNTYNFENIEILRQAYDLKKVPFKVKKVTEINCVNIFDTNILLLSQNKDLVDIINKNKCPFQLKII